REIARRWNIPVRNAVGRKRNTPPQAGLTNARRRANVQGAFAARSGERLDGLRVLLVDDVITTGATASACAGGLKRAGAKHVTVLTLARTDRRVGGMEVFTSDNRKSAAEAVGELHAAGAAGGSE